MIKVICNPDEMHSLRNEWNELAGPFKLPTLRHEWFSACAEAFCQPGQLRIVLTTSKQEITAIAPLVLSRHNGVEKLEFLGMASLYEVGGFIYKDETSLRELLSAVIAMKRPLVLRRIRSGSLELFLIKEICRNRIMLKSKEDSSSLFLPIAEKWSDFEGSMSRGSLARLRRKHRQAQKSGSVDFEAVSPVPDRLALFAEEVLRVESSGWKGRSGTAILSKPSMHKFFDLYMKEAARSGVLRLFFLKINGKVAAVRIAVEYANRLWELKIGYDETWSRCSPGLLLTHKTLMYAFDQGLEAYEFLGNDQPWIHMWTDHTHSYVSSYSYPVTVGGMVSLGLDASRSAAGKVLKSRKKEISLN